MINLALSIFFSSSLYVIFKYFEKYKINTLQAIITNYIVACVCGLAFYKNEFFIYTIYEKPWFIGAIFLGLLFISIFNLMAITSQKNGLSVASVSGKMGVVIPIIFAVIVYKEQLTVLSSLGVLIALLAVYFTSVKEKAMTFDKKTLIYPVLLFFGSGIIDTFIKFMETNYVNSSEAPLFLSMVFGIAGLAGFVILIVKANLKIELKNIVGGVLLGVPNYFSMAYLIKALQNDSLNSSTIFTINNVAIVALTTIFAILFFKEKLSLKNWLGIILAIISILFVTNP